MRRFNGIVLASVAALVGLTVLPAVAHAASPPEVNWARSVSDDLGTLQVSATAEAGVTALRAHIVSYATGTDVAVVEDFVLTSGTTQDGIWRTPEPVQLEELGFYRVDVEVTDGAGQHVFSQSAGTFSYLVRTMFSPLHADPTTVTYSDRFVRVDGVLTGRMPANREIRPVPGVSVFVGGGVGQPVAVTTAPDGSFTATVEMAGAGEVWAEFGGGSPYLRANAEPVEIAVLPAESKLSAWISESRVDAGESVTLSGRLKWRSPDGWRPLAGRQLGVSFCVSENYCPTSEYPVTDDNGRYRLTVTPWQTGFYRVAYPGAPFIARARTQVDIVVLQLAEFADFTAARNDSGEVVARGHMQFGNFTPWPIPVHIQYKGPGDRSWATVATVENAEWDGSGYAFSATVAAPRQGYWRAFYAGEPDFFPAVASEPVFVA